MRNLTIPLALLAAASLAACASHRETGAMGSSSKTAYVAPAEAMVIVPTETYVVVPVEMVVTAAVAPRPGTGKVVYIVDPTGPVNGISTQYLTLKMDDGSTQNLKLSGRQIAMGEHLRIRSDNSIRSASN